jgi:DNA-binding SARP family transcriptional activator
MIELKTLGAVELKGRDGREIRAVLTQPKRLALLVYLAVARPRGFHRRDVLLALFWPELDQAHARAALRKAVHVVRRGLGPDTLVGRGDEELGLAEGAVSCDASAFEQAVSEQRFGLALELYRGDLLEGFFISGGPEFERWVDGERGRLREQAAASAWALAEQAATDEHDALAVQWARRAMGFTPTDEGALRRLILLFKRMGDRAAALHVYRQFAARLAQEYGVRPSAETRRLIELVKASGEILEDPTSKRPPPAAPHR